MAALQHRDVLYQLQRYTIPTMAAAPVPVVALNEDSILLTCNGAEREKPRIDANDQAPDAPLRRLASTTQVIEFMSLSFPV